MRLRILKREEEKTVELDENLEKEENLKIEQRVEKFLKNEITVLLYILTI